MTHLEETLPWWTPVSSLVIVTISVVYFKQAAFRSAKTVDDDFKQILSGLKTKSGFDHALACGSPSGFGCPGCKIRRKGRLRDISSLNSLYHCPASCSRPDSISFKYTQSPFVYNVFLSPSYDNSPYCCDQITDMKAAYPRVYFVRGLRAVVLHGRSITAASIQGRQQAQSRVRKQSDHLIKVSFLFSSAHSRGLLTFRISLPTATESLLVSATATQTCPKLGLLGDCESSK